MATVTLLYGSLNLFLTWALGLHISLRRLREKEFSDGGSQKLKRAVRAHRNNVEWVFVGLFALFFAELQGLSSSALHLAGGTFLLARVLHAAGCLWPGYIRMIGAILTYLVLGSLLVQTLWSRLQ